MIYTLTINPSIDYVMEVEELKKGAMNRSTNTCLLPGGKGINVSQVLYALGIENTAILPVAGFTGEKLLRLLEEKNITSAPLKIEQGDTRINVKVLGKEETELNASGLDFTEQDLKRLWEKLEQVKDGDFLILSGSVPATLGTHFYADIMKRIQHKKVQVVVDTIGENFLNALPYKPFLVKPNKEELEDLFQCTIHGQEQLLKMAKKMQEKGARNVLVSLGGEGAMLLTEVGDVFYEKAPKGKTFNTVGAGDSMVAGFMAGIIQNRTLQESLKLSVAAGSASAFSKNLATKEEIDALFKNL